MRHFFSVICLLVCWMSACEPCRYVDCTSNDTVGIRFNSKADSSDLILSGIYSLASVNIKPLLKGSGSTPYINTSTTTTTNPGSFQYSIQLEVNSNTRGYAIQIGQLPVDTLLVIGNTETSRCCGTTTMLVDLILNGDTLAYQPYTRGIELYK